MKSFKKNFIKALPILFKRLLRNVIFKLNLSKILKKKISNFCEKLRGISLSIKFTIISLVSKIWKPSSSSFFLIKPLRYDFPLPETPKNYIDLNFMFTLLDKIPINFIRF